MQQPNIDAAMPETDRVLAKADDIAEAMALLTRLPVRTPDLSRGAAASWAYPLAGLAVGVLAAIVVLFGSWIALPASICAGLALAAMIIATGGLHEDGLADSADGLFGGWTVERRLEIMRDSRIGSYGVIALILGLGLRWVSLAELDVTQMAIALMAGASLSRVPMVWLMHIMPHARADGLSAATGRPSQRAVVLALLIGFIVAVLSTGPTALALLFVLIGTTFVIRALAARKIGGQTGDILGATQQISEIAILVVVAATLS